MFNKKFALNFLAILALCGVLIWGIADVSGKISFTDPADIGHLSTHTIQTNSDFVPDAKAFPTALPAATHTPTEFTQNYVAVKPIATPRPNTNKKPEPSPTATRIQTSTSTPTPPSIPTLVQVVVLSTANLRAGPGIQFDVVGKAVAGKILTAFEYDDTQNWIPLIDGTWIFAELVQANEITAVAQTVETTAINAPVSSWAIVQVDKLNVRQAPSLSANVIDGLKFGDCIAVISAQPEWLQVRYTDNTTGWCWREYIKQTDACPTPLPQIISNPAYQTATYIERPFKPNTTVAHNTIIHECFGSGKSPLRNVAANTPIEVLGGGSFQPPVHQIDALGNGPFYKIRLWDGQVAWIQQKAVNANAEAFASVSGICEVYDAINWAQIAANRPPTPTPNWSDWSRQASAPSTSSQGCCKTCRKGKACGDTCISRSYTCHVGRGCACNG